MSQSQDLESAPGVSSEELESGLGVGTWESRNSSLLVFFFLIVNLNIPNYIVHNFATRSTTVTHFSTCSVELEE